MLEQALPNRAPPPPGFDGDEVGGCPWHLDERYMTPAAIEARKRAEESMRNIITETKEQRAQRALQAEATAAGRNVVKVAVGRRVVVRPDRRGNGEGREARGIYQVDGRVLEDESRRAMPVAEFAAIAGVKKSPLKAIVVDGTGEAAGDDGDSDGMSLEQLLQMHGSIDVRARSANAQADPHCTLCGSGVSDPGNEILLCDGLNCVGCYHQKCVTPNVPEVPEGAWLCTSCIASGNIVDPHIEEEEMRMQECAVGEEKMVVMSNDGVGEQDIPLLREVVDVIDAALPLIGCINVAKLVFAPDHQSLVLVRETEAGQRRVLGAIVIKPHRKRGFLEIAYCTVRKEEQRNGVGSKMMAMLKEHAVQNLGVLHLLTYADDSATTFFERLGFDAEHPAGMPINRFHWGISHYIGSQLRQCVLDPDGATLYSPEFGRKVPENGRRLYAKEEKPLLLTNNAEAVEADE